MALSEITIYSTRIENIAFDEFSTRLEKLFPQLKVLSDAEPDAIYARWFVSLLAPESDDETMHDLQTLIIEITNDTKLANASAKILLAELKQAEQDEDTEKIMNALRNARQSFYVNYDVGENKALKKLIIALSGVLLKLGEGVLYCADNEEYFNLDNFENFIERYFPAVKSEILNFMNSL